MGYDRTRRNHAPFAYPDAAQNGYSKTDPDVVFNDHRCRIYPRKIGCETRMTFFDDMPEVLVALCRIYGVRGPIVDIYIVGNQNAVSDGDGLHRPYLASDADITPIPDRDFPSMPVGQQTSSDVRIIAN